ncbi:hypothetical protein GCM10020331_091870 [Ectobacillus funiculus]
MKENKQHEQKFFQNGSKKGEQTAEQGLSDDIADLIEQRKRLEEELQKNTEKKQKAPLFNNDFCWNYRRNWRSVYIRFFYVLSASYGETNYKYYLQIKK